MRFIVSRTSLPDEYTETEVIHPHPRVDEAHYDQAVDNWVVDFDSLELFREFVEEYGPIIVDDHRWKSGPRPLPCIEIYDYYRE